MKTREIFLIFAAFTLVFATLCVVTLTGSYSDTCVSKPIDRLNSDAGTTGTNRTIIHNLTDNPDNTSQTLKTKRTATAANKHPGNPRTNAWSSKYRVNNQENNSQLKAVESNGRVYLENTTGVKVCENDNDDEREIETIE